MNLNSNVTIICGPTASGKSFLSKKLQEHGYIEAVSTTTRERRENEIHGVDYYFITNQEFIHLINNNELVEHIKVGDFYYGLSQEAIHSALSTQKPIVTVLEPTGANNLSSYCDTHSIQCFRYYVNNPLDVLEQRLMERWRNDFSANNTSYKKRLDHLLYVEPKEWTHRAYSQEDFYDVIFDTFNHHNEDQILQFIINNNPLLKDNNKHKRNKPCI